MASIDFIDELVRDRVKALLDRPLRFYGESSMRSYTSTSSSMADSANYERYVIERLERLEKKAKKVTIKEEKKENPIYRFDPEELVND